MVVVLGGSAARSAAASSGEYGVVSWPSGVSRSTSPSSSRSAAAASMPSIDVPDMSPMTITCPPPRVPARNRRASASLRGDGAADDAAGLVEATAGGGGVDAGEEGHDGGLHFAVGGIEGGGGNVRSHPGGGDDDAASPVDELLASGPDVDHQVPEGAAEADHHDGGDGVQHELLGGAGL